MEITASQISKERSRSRSRTRNSTANSRSTSASRRPSLGARKRSISSSSLNKITVSSTNIENEKPIPTTSKILDNSLPLDFFKQDLIALIKGIKVSKWHKRNLNPIYLNVNRILGALTNSIYKLSYVEPTNAFEPSLPPPPALLLRVYGKNVESIIDREAELATLVKLSQKKIGPKLMGIFGNGRFEQFLDDYVTLNKNQIRDDIISQMLARRMKDLHSKIQLDVEDQFAELPMLWRLIYKWLDHLEEEITALEASGKFDLKVLFFMSFTDFRTLVETYKEWLFDQYGGHNFSQNFKFCHNDAQYGNLLLKNSFDPAEIVIPLAPASATPSRAVSEVNLAKSDSNANDNSALKTTTPKKDDNLVVIDFEYLGPNFPAYDLVNHFCEWMADYHDEEKSYFIDHTRYPLKLEQLNFIKLYIEYDFQYPSLNLITQSSRDYAVEGDVTALIEFEIKKLYNECVIWRSTDSIYWAVWGFLQNGPFVVENKVDNLHQTEEEGIHGTYSITTEMEGLKIEEGENKEEGESKPEETETVTSSDDDFEYIKYAQQKIGLFLGDMIQFGLLDKAQLSEEALKSIKSLNTDLFEL